MLTTNENTDTNYGISILDSTDYALSLGSCTGPCEALKEWLNDAWSRRSSNIHLRKIIVFASGFEQDSDNSSSRMTHCEVIGSVTAQAGAIVIDPNNPTVFNETNGFHTLTNTDKERLFSPFLQYGQNSFTNLVPHITSNPDLKTAQIVCPIVTYNAQIHGFLVFDFESSPLSPTVSVKLLPNTASMTILSLIIGDFKHIIKSAQTAKTIEELTYVKTDYETILDIFNGFIAYNDVDGNLFFMNKFGFDYFGTSMENVKDLKWVELIEGGRQEQTLQEWASVVQERNTKPVTMQTRLRCHNGEYHWFSHTVAFRNGKFCTISMDVEDLVSARYSAVENEALIRILVDNIPGIVWTADAKAEIDYMSPNFMKITGIQDGTGNNWLRSLHPDDLGPTEAALIVMRQLASVTPMDPLHATHKLRFVQRDGSYKQYQASYTSMLDENGRFCKWVGISIDIDEVENAKNHALALTRMMSHELRTPFAGVLGNLELLEDTSLTDEQKDLLFTAKKSTERLLDIINDILNFSKLEAGRMRIESIVFSLSDLVDDLIELLSPLVVDKGLELFGWVESSVDEYLIGDPTRIRQVILNLIGNAIKFSDTGYVRLTCSMKERLPPSETYPHGRILIECVVEDTGIGLTEEEQKILFKPFVQSDNSTTRLYGGTGLGLSISAELAKLMTGNITCESVKGRGSSFKFECIVGTAPPPSPASVSELMAPLSIENNASVYLISSSEYLIQQITSSLLGDVRNIQILHPKDGDELGREIANSLPASSQPRCAIIFDILNATDVNNLSKCLQSIRIGSIPPNECNLRVVGLVGNSIYHDQRLNTIMGHFGGGPHSEIGTSRIKWDIIKMRKPLCRRKILGMFAPREQLVEQQDSTTISSLATASLSGAPSAPPLVRINSSDARRKEEFGKKKALIAEDNPISQRLLVKQLKKAGFKTVVAANNGEEAVQQYKDYGPGYFDIGIFDHHMPLKDGAEAAKEIRKMEEAEGVVSQRLSIMCLTADVGQEAHQQAMKLGIDRVLTKPLSQKDLVKVLEELL